MRKVALLAVWVVSAILSLMFIGSSLAMADASGGDSISVQGVAHFEKRFTFVPYDICQGLKQCPQSRPYWAIVVDSPTAKYEIDQSFSEGQTRAPELVHLDGKTIRTGTQVRFDADVEYSGTDYYIVSDVHNVNLVMWYGDDADAQNSEFSNWTCHGYLDRETEIRVAVWSTGSQYGLRLIAAQEASTGEQTFPLAALNDVRAFADRDTVVYQGSDSSTSVELDVQQAAASPLKDRLDARVKFSLARLPEGAKIPALSEVDVSCNRTR